MFIQAESQRASLEKEMREKVEKAQRDVRLTVISQHICILCTAHYSTVYMYHFTLSSMKEILHHGMAYGSGLFNFTPVTLWH